MSLKHDTILDVIKTQPDRLTKREIAKRLGIGGDEKRDLRMALKAMVEKGVIFQNKNKTYRAATDLPGVMVLEIVRIDDDGDMIGLPAGKREDDAQEIIVFEGKRSGRRHERRPAQLGLGGRALVRINHKKNTGEVIKVLGRAPRRMLGVIIAGGRGMRIKPVDKKARDDYALIGGAVKVEDQDLVLFETASGRRGGLRSAKVVEHLGSINDPKSASLIALHEHNIPMGFPDEVLAEADALALPQIGGPREDLRHLPLVTIDPDDAKDFDDAICASVTETGFEVWVAIADVSAFVTPGSALDKAAYLRGNSVYLPDRVEPMLPHALSSNLCSLRPHEDRACLAVRMRFDKDGFKTGHKFHRGIMKSHARLTYGEAQEAFEGNPGEAALPVKDILGDIYTAYKALRSAREQRAPLDIDMPERRVRIGDDGRVSAIEVRERFDAHKLVEECMIQANVAAAEALDKKKQELIYRVHDQPARERLQGLSDFLPAMNMKWTLGERATTKRFNKLLEAARGKDIAEVIGMAVLRTQSQAIYSPKNGGHFGLNLTQYGHFTSPIRRYADLIVHRALIKAFDLGDDGLTSKETAKLQEISEHISDTERRAMAAERGAKDRYIAAYLSDRVDAKFAARISGVTHFGVFITLDETGADGLVPMRELGDEPYKFDEGSRSLIGYNTGGTYKFGGRCIVRLKEATPVSGGLIFTMESPPEPGKKPKGSRSSAYKKPYRGRKNTRTKSPAGRAGHKSRR